MNTMSFSISFYLLSYKVLIASSFVQKKLAMENTRNIRYTYSECILSIYRVNKGFI